MKNPKRRSGKTKAPSANTKVTSKRPLSKEKSAAVEGDATGELARQSSRAAWDRLLALLHHEDPKIALSVAQAILDRAWGKAGAGSPQEAGLPDKGALVIEVVTGIEPPQASKPVSDGDGLPQAPGDDQ